ncbi:MATE family efflux transporter [Ammoniphilus sp. 3BR4]|uniref:MATE family efflux transporter n=1 Tax=Ammoniphilus sp. 3BR4 TaxID=3158265 RepID=UPI0034664209
MSKKLTLFALTWPIFIEIFLHMLMGNADTLMLSQYSDDAVAAVGVANQILSVVIVMFGFVATGAGILIAQLLGAKKGKEASEYVALALFINFLFGLFISVVLFLFGESILRMMKLPEELMDQSLQYLQIVGGLSFIESLILTIGAIVRCHGFTKDAMYVTMGMNVLNVIGNYLFIFGPFGLPVLGVTGVALSTAVSRAIGLVVMFMILWKRVEGQIPFQCLFPFPKKELGQLLKIGIPSAGEHLAYNSSQVVITYFISLIGTESLTTKIYAQNISMFIFLFAVAMGQGTQILIGHLIGARKNEEAYNTCLRSLRIAMLISLGMASIFSLFREQLLGIFTDNPTVIALGSTLILLTIILEPGRTFNLVIINSLRSAGDVKFPVYMGILSMWGVGVTLSYLLGIHFGLGLIGVWIAFAADEWLRGLFMLWRWRSRVWEKMSFVNGKSQEGLGI